MSREVESVRPDPLPPSSGAPSADAGAGAHASPAPGMPCGFETSPDAGHR